MLTGVFGTFASGKTLLLAIFGYSTALNGAVNEYTKLLYVLGHRDAFWDNYKPYTNIHVDGVKTIEPEDFEDINLKRKKALVLLDEAYAWLDSRMSMSKTNRFLSYIVLQSRKRNMDVVYSAQLTGSVDLRLREMSDLFIQCQKVLVYNYRKKTYEPCFVYRTYEWKTLTRMVRHAFVVPWSSAEQYFDKFDTREIVSPIGGLSFKK